MIIQLEKGKEIFEVNIPMSCDEITASLYYDWRAVIKKLTPGIEGDTLLDSQIEEVIKEAVNLFVDASKFDFDGVYPEGYTISIGDEITVLGLFNHITNLLGSYETTATLDSFVKWKGEEYYFTPDAKAIFKDKRKYSVGEGLTVKEYEKYRNEQIELTGDVDGTHAYNLTIEQVAILLRKNKEQLPLNKASREKLIEDRVEVFSDLPISICFDVAFFLRITGWNYLQTLKTTTTSKEKRKVVKGIQQNSAELIGRRRGKRKKRGN